MVSNAQTCKSIVIYRESIMAARCAVCGKGPQPVRTTIDGENVRVRVCVKCIKAGKVQRVEA